MRVSKADATREVLRRFALASPSCFMPHKPWPKQQQFLALDCLEALYGGAAGGGKSDALLMAAAQYIHVPGYAALILRRTYADLALPGAIMDRAKSWWIPMGVTWSDKEKRFTFPSGASITFGFMDSENDKYRYQGAELQFFAVDELTQWPRERYTYLLSRLRRLQGSEVPLRARSTANPGGIGHDWVKRRFMDGGEPEAMFVAAGLDDNPSIDKAEYLKPLSKLDPVLRKQLLDGVWIRDGSGLVYARFDDAKNVIDALPKLQHYVLGMDFGIEDDNGITILGWRDHDPVVYVVASYRKKALVTEMATHAAELDAKYKFDKMVGDTGGMGKAFTEEMRRRPPHLPIEPADKQNKAGYVALMNGAFDRGHIQVFERDCMDLTGEWRDLPWNEARTKEAEGFDNHAADSCFVAGTMVQCRHGEVAIERVEVGMMVATQIGWRKVTAAWCSGVHPTWSMGSLEGTAKHPVFADGLGMVPLDSIQCTDILVAWESSASRYGWCFEVKCSAVTPTQRTGAKGSTSHLREAGACIEPSGRTRTGLSPPVTTSITSTRTRSIMTSGTCRQYQPKSTYGFTEDFQTERSAVSPGKGRPSGTAAQKASPGTQPTRRVHGRTAECSGIAARCALETMSRKPPSPTYAGVPASRSNAEAADSTTSLGGARSARSTSWQTSIPSRAFARVHATRATTTGRERPVYNLSVDEAEEYFANGVLVHNCLYAWRACISYYETARAPEPKAGSTEALEAEAKAMEQAAADASTNEDPDDWWK